MAHLHSDGEFEEGLASLVIGPVSLFPICSNFRQGVPTQLVSYLDGTNASW
jgi:hypothetical protein